MKTYLTPAEFVSLFWSTYDRKMETTINPDLGDKITWRMFQEYEKDVKDTLEGCLWDIDKWQYTSLANEIIGASFHKSFRQADVIPAKHIDGIVWSCLQDAPIFWACMEKACKILTSEDARLRFLKE